MGAEDSMTRPHCKCHDEPMLRDGMRPPGTQRWRCAIGNRDRGVKAYVALDGYSYNRKLLQHRRVKALVRMQQREA